MAKKSTQVPSSLTIAQLAQALDAAEKRHQELGQELASMEQAVSRYRGELSRRLNLGGAPGKRTSAARGRRGGDPSRDEVRAAMGAVLEAIPSSGKGVTAGFVRKKLNREPRVVELAFKQLNADGKIKVADGNAMGRYRPYVRL